MPADALNQQEADQLLRIARTSIEACVHRGETPRFTVDSKTLRSPRGVFVSLHMGGALRGCIGFVEPAEPLWEAVRDAAVSAAVHDPRFEPVSEDELSQIHVEISVLSPLERFSDLSLIEIGTHGLLIREGSHSGLLLPQVAVEYAWTPLQFIEQTCVKAGLDRNAWKNPAASLWRFRAQIFSEPF